MSSPNKGPRRALVIGAGPSGLVTAKYLLADVNNTTTVVVLEASHQIGGTFVNKVYDNTRLVSSKYLTAFSDHRMPEAYPNHPSADQYVQYLESYCDRFDITQHIRFQCQVISVQDDNNNNASSRGKTTDENDVMTIQDTNGYIVQYKDFRESSSSSSSSNDQEQGKIVTEHFDLVAVCSGLHNVPNIPKLPNQQAFQGTILHSSQYQEPSIFDNQRVLVCGSGETAMDICYRAVQNKNCQSVAMNVRRGFLSIPHTLPNDRPLDVFITNWLEHSHEHPWVHALRLRWWLSTLVTRTFLLATGSSVGFNQWACETKPIKRGYHIINKSHAAMAHMNVPIKRQWGWWGQFWLWVYGETHLKPITTFHRTAIARIDDNGKTVHFEDGRSVDVDTIVLATGYRQSFPFLDKTTMIQQSMMTSNDPCMEKNNKPNTYRLDEDPLPSEHFIVSNERPHLGFIGFVRPNVGAIPPMSELQVMWWLEKLKGNLTNPTLYQRPSTPSYMVLGQKYPYGVDYGNYMHRVAEDIGSAPTLSMLWRSNHPLRALYTYCQGQAYIGIFRLQGPYASKTCWNIFDNELWEVCLDRGWAENFGLASITGLSLIMNVVVCGLEAAFSLVTLRPPRLFSRYG
ncbi:unnamed protein product [Cylindrotheca closterium]|uniref:Dimethylaniline monooxygenase n=1 Tax=Cylindrotheca closterium TaxID=2856 RepID=A0AAD2FSJ2_9STRA|nr:unnamed protein product [Cylindrotheca closterium]